ncbi:hypothetical protein [Miniphocaeibacter massiliensis]|uniref:hypothetical protein n=1 Tax=Miniphocaeibacter massiliensis TaxID=2041841 RepID=UPI000C1BA60F|nr:hypothetical protein [Miniphocaeibacter massiliensis]
MYVSELREEHLDKIRSYNGTKTIKELTEIFNIQNESTENLRKVLKRNKIKYKHERKGYLKNYKGYTKAEQVPGIKLEVGKKYSLTDNTNSKEELFTKYQGKIIGEYRNYYLGRTDKGILFTIHKYPLCYEIKEI